MPCPRCVPPMSCSSSFNEKPEAPLEVEETHLSVSARTSPSSSLSDCPEARATEISSSSSSSTGAAAVGPEHDSSAGDRSNSRRGPRFAADDPQPRRDKVPSRTNNNMTSSERMVEKPFRSQQQQKPQGAKSATNTATTTPGGGSSVSHAETELMVVEDDNKKEMSQQGSSCPFSVSSQWHMNDDDDDDDDAAQVEASASIPERVDTTALDRNNSQHGLMIQCDNQPPTESSHVDRTQLQQSSSPVVQSETAEQTVISTTRGETVETTVINATPTGMEAAIGMTATAFSPSAAAATATTSVAVSNPLPGDHLQPADFAALATTASTFMIGPRHSWDEMINREIEEARRAAATSTVSDPLGMEQYAHALLEEVLMGPSADKLATAAYRNHWSSKDVADLVHSTLETNAFRPGYLAQQNQFSAAASQPESPRLYDPNHYMGAFNSTASIGGATFDSSNHRALPSQNSHSPQHQQKQATEIIVRMLSDDEGEEEAEIVSHLSQEYNQNAAHDYGGDEGQEIMVVGRDEQHTDSTSAEQRSDALEQEVSTVDDRRVDTDPTQRTLPPTGCSEQREQAETKQMDQGFSDVVVHRVEKTSDASNRPNTNVEHIMLTRSLSATESDVGSIEGLPSNLQRRWLNEDDGRDSILQNLDGVVAVSSVAPPPEEELENVRRRHLSYDLERERDKDHQKEEKDASFWGGIWNFIWGEYATSPKEEEISLEDPRGQDHYVETDDTLALLLGCSTTIHREDRAAASLVRVTSQPPPPSYAETIQAAEVDPRMQDWVESQYLIRDRAPKDGSYYLGKSRTVIVHEIARGGWTWCTDWSPDGHFLAVATENHHLAVIDTRFCSVWRVQHDERITGRVKNHTTHSIRSIAWGTEYIACGGTGNAVSILSTTAPYSILHTIRGTGFVGSLHWMVNSKDNVLAIGSRLDKVMIVRVRTTEAPSSKPGSQQVDSEFLRIIKCKDWANSVKFSPGGTCLAIGEASGIVSVYNYVDEPGTPPDLSHIKSFTMEDSILSVEWSPDGKWLYAGGEDFTITVIDSNYWEMVHKIARTRWVQCISSSNGGSHLAVGGVSSEISLLDTKNGWDSVMGVELKGLVPLSATWHPKDQYLAVTGQTNSILVFESTNARHVRGHHLYSVSAILAIEFSPDGRMAAIANEMGVVTFFSLSGSTFVTAYELVVTLTDRVCIRWSPNGMFVIVGGKDSVVIVGRTLDHAKGVKDQRKPPNSAGFSVRKVIREFDGVTSVAINCHSDYVAICGSSTWILDVRKDFKVVAHWKSGNCQACAWSPDGNWLATFGKSKVLTIYDTSERHVDRWSTIFSLKCEFEGQSLAWGPLILDGLLYLAYGGNTNEITIMEVRTKEGTWELVLRIQREGSINSLDWGKDGLLAAAIGNGTVCLANLAYLQTGLAVNEMDYNWQRQALTCYTEIRRNRGVNSMSCV